MLKEIFIALTTKCSNDVTVSHNLWETIEKAYTGKKRYYHNLVHLENMYNALLHVEHLIADWDTLLFSLFYHDIVYKASAKDNEEKSAAIAIKSLASINYPSEKIIKCSEQILATKLHLPNSDIDTCLLLDADMAILGANEPDYEKYYLAVRKEYAIYPDFLYNPGRAKVLNQFLAMDNIFSTNFFMEKYERKAIANLKKELEYFN